MVSGGSIKSFVYRKIPWNELEDIQSELVKKASRNSKEKFLLLSEPLPTFTFGRNALKEDLLWSGPQIQEHGIIVAPVTRGGKWTYHGPGQVLIYPIGSLHSWGFSSKGAKAFVDRFRSSIADSLNSWGLSPESKEDPYGLYLNQKKITSFGMSFENGVSSHGAALYLTPQKAFSGIIPCGVQEMQFTSLSDFLPSLDWVTAANQVLLSFKKGFKLA